VKSPFDYRSPAAQGLVPEVTPKPDHWHCGASDVLYWGYRGWQSGQTGGIHTCATAAPTQWRTS
jgi:hypothetical protein